MIKRFEDIIAEQGRLIYTNVGDSMYPTIQPRDLLVIEAVSGPLKVGDVPLYKRDSGQYVLHRIVAKRRGRYVMKGDNRTEAEYGIADRHIIGVLTGVIRSGETLPVAPPPEPLPLPRPPLRALPASLKKAIKKRIKKCLRKKV